LEYNDISPSRITPHDLMDMLQELFEGWTSRQRAKEGDELAAVVYVSMCVLYVFRFFCFGTECCCIKWLYSLEKVITAACAYVYVEHCNKIVMRFVKWAKLRHTLLHVITAIRQWDSSEKVSLCFALFYSVSMY
jgi:hypothetical protein